MSWTSPRTWVTGELVSASYLNTYIRDNDNYLKAQADATLGYVLQLATATQDPADSTTYFGGGFPSFPVGTTAVRFNVAVPQAGTITKGTAAVKVEGTLGSSENIAISVRLNNTTDASITSVGRASARVQTYSNASMSLAVAAGAALELKIVTPAWVTNPTQVAWAAAVYITP